MGELRPTDTHLLKSVIPPTTLYPFQFPKTVDHRFQRGSEVGFSIEKAVLCVWILK